jgi:excisionase family DNA binding protein
VKVVRRAIDAGELPAFKVRTRLRIRHSDFDAWIEGNRVQSRAEPEVALWP